MSHLELDLAQRRRVYTSYVAYRSRLYELFGLIEKEFESLFAENLALHAKVEALTERLTDGGALAPERAAEILGITAADVVAAKQPGKKGSQMGQKIKTAFRVPPGRFVSSFKVGGDGARARHVCSLEGHRDGIWHVATTDRLPGLVASASADQTARIWSVETGRCVLQYTGHRGSVNSVSFNAKSSDGDALLVTASGDQAAHVWKMASFAHPPALHSSEDELELASEKDEAATETEPEHAGTVKHALVRLTGHVGVVIAADWLAGGEQVITASWDRTANVYDAESGKILHILSGHDEELTHCSAHGSQRLVVTSSRDTTFRLWDFREPIHSVAVFQGHAESVTSTVFALGDQLVSGSDDRTVKVWDLRNMRSSLATIRLDSAANRLAVSRAGTIAVPHDNRHVRLFDLSGLRLTRLPRGNRRCHRRMVCCTAWSSDNELCNLFSCGFDRQLIGWKVVPTVNKD